LGAALVIFVLPFFEELVFRGFLQPLFVQNLGDRGGVFLTSLVFAIPHGDSAFLPIFGLALLLGSLKLRTQRLSAPYAVHALHNAVAFVLLGYPVHA
jgi:membrane protease YdiL (CAAX protease family)